MLAFVGYDRELLQYE